MKHGWEIKKLGEVCNLTMGQSPSSDTYNDSEGLPFFQGNADFGKIHPSIRVYCNAPIRVAEFNDILISVRAPIGAINIANCKCCIGRGLASIRNGESVVSEFIYYALLANRDKLIAQGTGSTFKSIGRDILNKLPIPIPPLSIQERIVSELDCINGIIEKKREQLKELDALAQSIFYDMFGDPIQNEKGWEVKKLGEVCTDIVDGDHMPPPKSETGIPFITISNIDKDSRTINFSNTFYTTQEYFDSIKPNKIARKGDILYTVTGSYGIPILLNENIEFCFQRHIGLLKPKSIINSIYLCYWALMPQTKAQADFIATGIAQKTVSLKGLRNFTIPLPPLPLQQAFAEKIEAIEKQKELVKRSIAETETLLASRMQHYFDV